MASILIVDDERSIRNTLKEILEFEKYEVTLAQDGKEALELIQKGKYDIVLCDVKMPKMDGIEVLTRANEWGYEGEFIMISGHLNIETAVEATRKGAYDFIEKPPDLNRLLITIRNALDKSQLVSETRILKKKVSRIRPIIGESDPVQKIRETIEKVAPTDARVLITGSNGTGKELVARWIHENSLRADQPFIEVNCAAIPSELIESELFGHEKGAFTSAHKQRSGKFEQADGGTLFLDEIGDMSLAAQAKVLRALQENKISRVGGDKSIQVNVRVVAATNKNLHQQIKDNQFREDLYHRLSVIVLHMPALTERPEDIPVLAHHFLRELSEEHHTPEMEITEDALKVLQTLSWTGNVRELRNVIERLVIFCDRVIDAEAVHTHVLPFAASGHSLFDQHETLSDFRTATEKQFLEHKLRKHQWQITPAAQELKLDADALKQLMNQHGIRAE